jgi:hypothetical protein
LLFGQEDIARAQPSTGVDTPFTCFGRALPVLGRTGRSLSSYQHPISIASCKLKILRELVMPVFITDIDSNEPKS